MFKTKRPEPDPLGDIYALYEDLETLTRLCIKELWNALIQKNFGTRYVETLIAADRLSEHLGNEIADAEALIKRLKENRARLEKSAIHCREEHRRCADRIEKRRRK